MSNQHREIPLGSFQNTNNEVFDLSWYMCDLPGNADYRFYVIKSKHKKWGQQKFRVVVKKSKYPNELDADNLVTTHCIEEVKNRLNTADSNGIPISIINTGDEGWGMV